MQSSVSKINKFLFLNQKYQHDQQNSLQNQIQIVLIFVDQNQNSDYLESDLTLHHKCFYHLKLNFLQHDMIEQNRMIENDLQ